MSNDIEESLQLLTELGQEYTKIREEYELKKNPWNMSIVLKLLIRLGAATLDILMTLNSQDIYYKTTIKH